ncbi:hypothetical protein KFL_007310030 [Klebsormidium nitens]|uniref:Chromo domain-containing protein n=1 Tax=Klebsormidium nitens TaxID=105231 RepID=A0A1Y1IQT6_KLENI|nr:hypothetical protein KFL_007310030 [Klebsormidium nitens]|eukprot:GAQ91126.1 hypothetical protein KFL_007310030 [Klebsormidium nitens]
MLIPVPLYPGPHRPPPPHYAHPRSPSTRALIALLRLISLGEGNEKAQGTSDLDMSAKKQKIGDVGASNPMGRIDAVAAPLQLMSFSMLLDCLKLFPQPFPLRTEIIASILNSSLPPDDKVDRVVIKNVIDKLKGASGDLALLAGAKRPAVEEIASNESVLFVAFPQLSKCFLCSEPLRWVDEAKPRRPFFFPYAGPPGKGILQEKFCPGCKALFSLSYYCPPGSQVRRPYSAAHDDDTWLELTGETVISKELLRRHDQNLYYMHASFVSAVRAHNASFDLDRFSEEPGAALERLRRRRSLRGCLNRERFEHAYFQFWAVRFCQEHSPSLLEEIDLREPIDNILSGLSDPFWCHLRDEALEHSKKCDHELCGRYCHFDGNAKVFRSCCAKKNETLFQTAIGRVVKGCPKTPVKNKKYCRLHQTTAQVQTADHGDGGAQPGARPGHLEGSQGGGGEGQGDRGGQPGSRPGHSEESQGGAGAGQIAEAAGGDVEEIDLRDLDSDDELEEEEDLEDEEGVEGKQGNASGGGGSGTEGSVPVAEKWDTESGPVSLRTRGKRRLLRDDNSLYEAERIEMHQLKNGVPIYLVKWKGCPAAENTWEPEENVTVINRDLLDEYLRSQPKDDFYTRDRKDQEPDPAPEDDAEKPRRKSKLTACTPRTSSDGRGVTAGTLVAFWACGYMFPPLELILSESTTMVHHYMMLLFAHEHLPEFMGMDDMCHWARFAASGDRTTLSDKTREFHEETKKVVDKFHFKKNHVGRWCAENTNPYKHPELEAANMPVCEQRFKWWGQFRNSLR